VAVLGILALSGCAGLVNGEGGPVPGAAVPAVAVSPQAADPHDLDAAERALAVHHYVQARALAARVAARNPGEARARLIEAEVILATGDPDAAARAFAALTARPAVAIRALQGQGLAHLKAGNRQAALSSLRRALARDDGLWRAWNGLGVLYDARRAWTAAYESYARALAIRPDAGEVHNNMGVSFLLQGRYREAQDAFERALSYDPELRLARANLRLALAWQGRYDTALLGVTEREKARALNDTGFVALMRGEHATAEALFRRAIAADPRYNPVAVGNLVYLEDLRRLGAVSPPSAIAPEAGAN